MNFARTYSAVSIAEKDLPYSRMVFPSTVVKRLKYWFWRMYTPFHPFARDLALNLHLVTPPASRQNYVIGHLVPGVTIAAIVEFLVERGYGNHFIAWKDQGEVVSLRRVVGFEYQYHIRIFEDGEIRGHYEYTPECYPLLHYRAINQTDRRSYFYQLFGDLIHTEN